MSKNSIPLVNFPWGGVAHFFHIRLGPVIKRPGSSFFTGSRRLKTSHRRLKTGPRHLKWVRISLRKNISGGVLKIICRWRVRIWKIVTESPCRNSKVYEYDKWEVQLKSIEIVRNKLIWSYVYQKCYRLHQTKIREESKQFYYIFTKYALCLSMKMIFDLQCKKQSIIP